MDSDRLRELLEACRTDSADQGLSEVEALELREQLLDDPQLQTELARLQRWDMAISSSIEDIPVPMGLAQRLQAAVALEMASPTVPDAPDYGAATEVATVSPAKLAEPMHPSRRRWLLAVVSTAAVVFIALGLGNYLRRPLTVDVAALDAEVRELTAKLADVAWEQDKATLPMDAFPNDVRVAPQRWASVSTSLDRKAVVFDLVRVGAPQAVVIAMRAKVASNDLPSRPQLSPDSSTAGQCVGSWQQGQYVYSLVVSGNRARYQLFLRDPAQLTANWPSPVLSH